MGGDSDAGDRWGPTATPTAADADRPGDHVTAPHDRYRDGAPPEIQSDAYSVWRLFGVFCNVAFTSLWDPSDSAL